MEYSLPGKTYIKLSGTMQSKNPQRAVRSLTLVAVAKAKQTWLWLVARGNKKETIQIIRLFLFIPFIQ